MARAGAFPTVGIPRGPPFTETGPGPLRGAVSEVCEGLNIPCGISTGERANSWPQLEAFHVRADQISAHKALGTFPSGLLTKV